MSRLYVHRRQSSGAARSLGHGLRRRLGFEVMEGRCLLSAATLQFTAFSTTAPQETSQISTVAPIGGQQVQKIGLVEGGFVSLGGLQSQSVPRVSTNANGTGSPGLAFDVIGSDSYAFPFADATTNFNTGIITSGHGFGLRPVVISPSDGGNVVKPGIDPPGSREASHGRGDYEGGIVAIESILGGDKPFDSGESAQSMLVDDTPARFTAPDDSSATSARSRALPADPEAAADAPLSSAATQLAVSLDQRTADFLRPAKSDVITGELARAVVFEMAGGEPASVRPVMTIEKVTPVVPVGGQESPPADAPPLSSATGQQTARQTTTGRIRLSGNQVEFTLSRDHWSESNFGGRLGMETPAGLVQSGAPGSRTSAFDAADSAIAEVFQQLGRSEQAPVRGSFEDDARTGPLVAGSVMALLMLERAVARYRSRTEKELLTVAAGPPRI